MKKRFLFFFFIAGIVLMNACEKEHSFESGNGASDGTLQDDGTGDCLPKTVSGAYVVGTALVGTSNYIEVEVDVVHPGSYLIYTDTVNGMFFRVSGVFTATGLNTVRLRGNGTPISVGIDNFIVHYGTSGCTIAVTTVSTFATFTLDGAPGGCMGASVAGTYTVGTQLTASNNVTINVNVTAVGAYTISTVTSNAISFTGSGTFVTTGPQAIVLTGTGTPASAGNTNIPVTAGSSNCSFTVNVGSPTPPATFTVNCASAVVNGTYTQNTALTSSNTVSLGVNVTAVGSYVIVTTATSGMTFSASGTFAATGVQTITLAGTGTPSASGAISIPVTAGTTSCNFTVNVVPAAGAAVYTVNCGTAVVNGTYTQNAVLTASNTVSIGVNVTTAGSYTITTTATSGMTFSASGTFAATGVQTVTLAGTGTPNASGAISIPVPSGATPCNFTVNVVPAAGAAVYTVNCGTAVVNGTYTQNTVLTAANTVSIGVTVATAGSYTITTTTTSGMTFSASGNFAATGVQTVTLAGTGTPTVSGAISIPVPSGATPCNFTVNVLPAAGGASTFVVNCGSATVNGTYTAGTPLAPTNTVIISVNVTVIGTYTITTTATNGVTFSASGTFVATGNQNVTLNGSGTPTASGTFSIPVPSGTTPCSFSLTVNPGVTSLGTWSFKVGTTTFSGTFDDGGVDNSQPPFLLLFMTGSDATGNSFELDLVDVNTFTSGENYNCATFNGTANTGAFYYDGPPPTYDPIYDADFTLTPNSVVIHLTTYNAATKTATGTFSGNAQDPSGNPIAITNGTFTITYP